MKKTKKTAKKVVKKAIRMNPAKTGFKIQPTADRVLIKELVEGGEDTTASGIIIPVNAEKDSGSKRGKVVVTGPGRTEDGKTVAVSVKTGDTVLFQWGEKIVVDNEEYYLVRDAEILAIVN
jgi:chaperonin GroES